jgi:hypothetical protein
MKNSNWLDWLEKIFLALVIVVSVSWVVWFLFFEPEVVPVSTPSVVPSDNSQPKVWPCGEGMKC